MNKAVQNLKTALETLENGNRWTRYTMKRTGRRGELHYCALGAMAVAEYGGDSESNFQRTQVEAIPGIEELGRAAKLEAREGEFALDPCAVGAIANFNDNVAAGFSDIEAVFLKAIEYAGEGK
ncbi:hypothetical protein [Nocardia sp. NPDC057440]|uniref:DUF6197 family protein n=1 Tax=Nocardia sp. NPDC057440 TaxID=3346134 RepID=UPI00366DC911